MEVVFGSDASARPEGFQLNWLGHFHASRWFQSRLVGRFSASRGLQLINTRLIPDNHPFSSFLAVLCDVRRIMQAQAWCPGKAGCPWGLGVTTWARKLRGQALSAGTAVGPDELHNSHRQFSKAEEKRNCVRTGNLNGFPVPRGLVASADHWKSIVRSMTIYSMPAYSIRVRLWLTVDNGHLPCVMAR
jgi:hypothetical protein